MLLKGIQIGNLSREELAIELFKLSEISNQLKALNGIFDTFTA